MFSGHSLTQVFMVNSLINIQSDKPQNNTCGYFKNELDSLVLLFETEIIK